ncbi:MAG: DEAD/DEAH box helicase family protein [Desulfoplanes sp.]|nr:DEAD/DEAH box helicase family protein [Desulfoplanes sp.]
MAKRKSSGPKHHPFRNKLLLNQWLISLFGIDPFQTHTIGDQVVRPFHVLSEPLKAKNSEGLTQGDLHKFFYQLTESTFFKSDQCRLSLDQIKNYEENIVSHTKAINEKRDRPVVWKYYQWLTLLFVEIYLDRFFGDIDGLLEDLNAFADRFNAKWTTYAPLVRFDETDTKHEHNLSFFEKDDLNKLCIQSATGSGKTLLMHVNMLQFKTYAAQYGRDKNLSRVFLLTPNARLSEQHVAEFKESDILARVVRTPADAEQRTIYAVDVFEITKLGDKQGPGTIATKSLGNNNLLLVDEGHRGLSGKNVNKEENVWFKNRAMLCEKGFTFEYSATFEQAVSGGGHEDDYARTVLFDYSYRWFYEDGFGKDYKIDNLPHPDQGTIKRLLEKAKASRSASKKALKVEHDREVAEAILPYFLTAALLKFYQQLRIYQDKHQVFKPFNLEKPLWVFVGSTVTKAKGTKDEKAVASDVGKIITFIADFLGNKKKYSERIHDILTGKGQDTGLLDADGNDIFAGAFDYLNKLMNGGFSLEDLYLDILTRLFNNGNGGNLTLARIKGESGEIALRTGTEETPFGLINVGDAKGLCDHILEIADGEGIQLSVEETDFSEAMFSQVRESSSKVNLLIGSKKFVEGWDCWRVSSLGLMHVGKSEGSQIIQLFGRGVRLKGYEWSLKRSGHSYAPSQPEFIHDLETLNVFGIEADFMDKFRKFLKDEGLPGNEQRQRITIPLNVTFDIGKKLQILRPKRKKSDGKEYEFKKDGPVPTLGKVPEYLTRHRVEADWYPRIHSMESRDTKSLSEKDQVSLGTSQLALLDFDTLYFELERFKRERSWHNLNISKKGIKELLSKNDWYTLLLPEARLNPSGFDGVRLLQRIATELLKRHCDALYNYRRREFIEPRLELRDLTLDDDNLPQDDEYELIVDGSDTQVIQSILEIKDDLEKKKNQLTKVGDLSVCDFDRHLFQPVFNVRKGGKITILPVSLNPSEFQFVSDLKSWCAVNHEKLVNENTELFLLRNLSRGKGVGFFEAGGFHPDFILWVLTDDQQYIVFVEPHGLIHEGPGSRKVQFYHQIKDIETRLNKPGITLESFIVTPTKFSSLEWGVTKDELEERHVLFMADDKETYVGKLLNGLET